MEFGGVWGPGSDPRADPVREHSPKIWYGGRQAICRVAMGPIVGKRVEKHLFLDLTLMPTWLSICSNKHCELLRWWLLVEEAQPRTRISGLDTPAV